MLYRFQEFPRVDGVASDPRHQDNLGVVRGAALVLQVPGVQRAAADLPADGLPLVHAVLAAVLHAAVLAGARQGLQGRLQNTQGQGTQTQGGETTRVHD